MGHYSTLKIGNEELSWKYEVPEFLSFLFDENELITKYDNEEEYYETISYQSTCKNSISKLENLGFDWDLFLRVYEYFYDNLKDTYAYQLTDELNSKFKDATERKIKNEFSKKMESLNNLTKKQQLQDFAIFFVPILRVSQGKDFEKIKSLDGKFYNLKPMLDKYNNPIAFDAETYIYDKFLELPAWICIIFELFQYDYLSKFTEIISLFQIKLLLHSNNDNDLVVLELNDIIENKEELDNFHIESAKKLIDKINLYNDFFSSILNQKEYVKEIYLRNELRIIIDKIDNVDKKDIYIKGKLLEDLVETIVNNINGLDVIEKRMNNGDEEIDIVAKNNINKPFWQSLSSPCLFFECKNWSYKIGTKEIRDFEIKLQNHNKLVKLGVFISYNGFSKEVYNELKRMSRDDYHIVLISKNEIEDFIKDRIKLIDWFENLTTKFH